MNGSCPLRITLSNSRIPTKWNVTTGFSVELSTLGAANGNGSGNVMSQMDEIFVNTDDVEAADLLEASIRNVFDPEQI